MSLRLAWGQKQSKQKQKNSGSRNVTQLAKHFPTMHEARGSIPSPRKQRM